MTNRLEDRIHTKKPPQQHDRCTVLLTCHYQEWENPTTTAKWVYDRTLSPENVQYQRATKVSPSVNGNNRVEVKLGDLEFGKCEIVLGHNPVKLSPDSEGASVLQEMQESNTIRITDSSGKLVVEIGSGRCAFGQFAGPLYAHSTKATAFLSITAMPL